MAWNLILRNWIKKSIHTVMVIIEIAVYNMYVKIYLLFCKFFIFNLLETSKYTIIFF